MSARSIATKAGLALVVALAAVQTAWAGLGESVETIAHDHLALEGRALSQTPMPAYDRHEIMTTTGVRIREYATRSGTVFAVAFSGPSIPDLRVLLAQHYAAYLAEAARPRVNHRAMSIESPGLVLSIVKLPRGFVGTAHVPTLVPAGVAPRELR